MMQENNFIRRDAKSQSKDQLSPKAVMKPAAKRVQYKTGFNSIKK
jgi:hypothetical protein